MHIGEGQMLYISIFIGRWGWGDHSWVWGVETGSKVGGSAEHFGHLGIGCMPKIFYVNWEFMVVHLFHTIYITLT